MSRTRELEILEKITELQVKLEELHEELKTKQDQPWPNYIEASHGGSILPEKKGLFQWVPQFLDLEMSKNFGTRPKHYKLDESKQHGSRTAPIVRYNLLPTSKQAVIDMLYRAGFKDLIKDNQDFTQYALDQFASMLLREMQNNRKTMIE